MIRPKHLIRGLSAAVVLSVLHASPLLAKTLKVGSAEHPFVIQKDLGFEGISLEVWEKVAKQNNSPTS